MPLQNDLDVQGALIYFHAYMYGPYQGRARLFRLRGLEPRMVMSEDWEVFASILLKSMGSASRGGPDLGEYEVKSAVDGSSFEYQYHRNSWEDKLAADSQAGHVFIWHRDELSHVEVWFCEGSALAEQFDSWRAENPYADDQQQRFRKNITAKWVKENATPLLCIVDGEPDDDWPSEVRQQPPDGGSA